MDQIKVIKSFVQVIASGSFSGAASRLGLSRAMVTKHVIELEEHLKTRLINRTTRRLALTAAGSEYYEFSLRLLKELSEKDADLMRLPREARGSLKIIAPKSFGSIYLAKIIPEFAQAYPDIRLMLTLGDFSVQPFDLIDDELDVAFMVSDIRDSSIMAKRIGTLGWCLCASADYLRKNGEPSKPRDLASLNCLTHTKFAEDRTWRFADSSKTTVKIGGTYSSNSVIILREAAIAGVGIAMLPRYCIGSAFEEGDLQPVLERYPVPKSPFYLLYRKGPTVPKKVRLFIDFISRAHRKYDELLS